MTRGNELVARLADAYAALHGRPLTDQKEAELRLRDARDAIIARVDQRDELLVVLKEILATLKKEAPGTPLNDRRFVDLGIAAAYPPPAKAESAP